MGRKDSKSVLNKKSTKEVVEIKEEKEVVEQEVHINEINEEENSQILIGDNKGIEPVSDNPVIYGELKTESIEEDIVSEEVEDIVSPAPRTLNSLSKAELRFYQRTGIMPK